MASYSPASDGVDAQGAVDNISDDDEHFEVRIEMLKSQQKSGEILEQDSDARVQSESLHNLRKDKILKWCEN